MSESTRGSARSTLLISGGTFAGQIVTLIALPILARMYSPADFGVYALALAAVALGVPFAVLRLDRALLLPEKDSTTRSLLSIGVAVSAVVAVVVGVGTWVFGAFDRDPLISVLTGVLLFGSALIALFVPLVSRAGGYGSLGLRTATQSVSGTASQLGLGAAGLASSGLVGGAVVGSVVGLGLLGPYAWRLRGRVSPRAAWTDLRNYWRFPLVFMPIAFLTLLAQQVPLLFGAAVFGTDAAGGIGMAERVVAIPIALLGLAAGTVFEGEIARSLRRNRNDLLHRYLRTSALLAAVGLCAAAVLALAAPWALHLLFGEEWSQAGAIAQAMSVVVVTRLVVSATRNLLPLLQRSAGSLALEAARVLLVGGTAVLAGALGLDLVSALWLIYGALAVADVVLWIGGLRAVRQHGAAAAPAADAVTAGEGGA